MANKDEERRKKSFEAEVKDVHNSAFRSQEVVCAEINRKKKLNQNGHTEIYCNN